MERRRIWMAKCRAVIGYDKTKGKVKKCKRKARVEEGYCIQHAKLEMAAGRIRRRLI